MSADNFVVIRKFPEGWKWAMGFASSDDSERMPDERFTSKAFDDVEEAYKDAEEDCGYIEYGIDIEWPKETPKLLEIAGMGTFYGGLRVMLQDGKYYWSILDHNGDDWKEIPKSLYDELIRYNEKADEK